MPPFKPGNQFGGKSPGRPRGTRDRVCARLDKRAEDDALRVLQSLLTAAINGDVPAAKVIADRVWPVPKGVFIKIELPFLANAKDVEKASARIIDELANGRLRSDEAEAIHAALRRHVEIKSGLATGELLEALEARLAEVERDMAAKERAETAAPEISWP